jgi:hypothetical protein
MRPDDVRPKLRIQPFQPFRIRLSNGNTYDVPHPDLVMVGRSSITIGTPAPDLPGGVYDTAVTVSLLHVAEFLPLTIPTTPPGTNGPAA